MLRQHSPLPTKSAGKRRSKSFASPSLPCAFALSQNPNVFVSYRRCCPLRVFAVSASTRSLVATLYKVA